MFVEHKGSLEDTLIEMEQDLQSSISYAGGTKLDSIRTVDYVVVKTLFSTVIKYINFNLTRRTSSFMLVLLFIYRNVKYFHFTEFSSIMFLNTYNKGI